MAGTSDCEKIVPIYHCRDSQQLSQLENAFKLIAKNVEFKTSPQLTSNPYGFQLDVFYLRSHGDTLIIMPHSSLESIVAVTFNQQDSVPFAKIFVSEQESVVFKIDGIGYRLQFKKKNFESEYSPTANYIDYTCESPRR